MRYLLLLLPATAMAAHATPLTFVDAIGVQTVLTRDTPEWCHGRYMAFDVDGMHHAYYGCWTPSQGFAHIRMLDGSQRVIPLSKFSKQKETVHRETD